jgi:transcriptional regulator with XRE-family HTH domain
MERKKIDFRIRQLGMSRSQIAALTGISRSDLANFLNEVGNLPTRRTQGLLDTLAALETGLAELQKQWPGFSFNLKDMDFLRRIVAVISEAEKLTQTELEASQAELQRLMGEADKAFSLSLK